MSRILIAGCGKIGSALGLQLVGRGHEVWGLRRNCKELPSPIKPVQADLSLPATLKALPGRLDFVFIILTADRFDDESYRNRYVECTQNLLITLKEMQEQPARIFFTSSTSVYGQTEGGWVDETSSPTPGHFSGRRILEAEKILNESSFACTCIRLAGIYGPDRTRLLKRVRNRNIFFPKDPPMYRNLIHQNDVLGILLHLVSLRQPCPLYNGVDNEPVSCFDLVEWMSIRLGVSGGRRAGHKTPMSIRGASNKRCSNQRLIQSGYQLKYATYREGYGEIIDSIKNKKIV